MDDGSLDDTAALAEAFAAEHPAVRVIRNPHAGKAFAVRTGVESAAGALVFFCDADLAMPIAELAKFLPLMDQGWDIVIGSREGPGARRVGEPAYRHLMGRVFNYVVRAFTTLPFDDTQCGFKCLRTEVARDLFNRVMVYRDRVVNLQGPMVTGFDVELLFLALKLGYRVTEVGVEWHYAPGSKVNPLKDTYRMVRDVWRVRRNYDAGRYQLPPPGNAHAATGQAQMDARRR